MGEAKRRRQNQARLGFAPDYGIALWDAGHRSAVSFVYMTLGGVHDYGKFREVTGHLHLDDGGFCMTVRTPQRLDEIAALEEPGGMIWASGKPTAEIYTGNSGERNRVLVGSIGIESER